MDERRDSLTQPSSATGVEDIQIVKRVLAGDCQAFRGIVERHQGLVYHAAFRVLRDREDAEDVAQEVFVKAYTNLARYDSRWPLAKWLAVIATRTALNAVRARRVEATALASPLSVADEPVAPGPSPFQSAQHNEWMERLRREVNGLSHWLRVLFGMRYEDHLTIDEIARATESTETSVKVALHRARKILRERLREFRDVNNEA